MKQYTKPSVREGRWYTRAQCMTPDHTGTTPELVKIEVKRQYLHDEYQDHYAIYIDDKRQRKTYFGETAHWAAASAFNNLVHWTQTITGDVL